MEVVAVRKAAPSTWKVPVRAVGPSNSMVTAFTVNAPVITVSPVKNTSSAFTRTDPAIRFRLMKSVPAVTSSPKPTVAVVPRSTPNPAERVAPPVTDS